MIPLRSSEPAHSTPRVVLALIAGNMLVFFYQLSLGRQLPAFVSQWGITPDTINQNLYSLATSMFLHGGWLHVLSNNLFLWVFGRNVEDRIGSRSFLLLYLACGVAAGIVHIIANPYSRVPTIGASGAIAGVMGAYLIRFPRTDIDALFWLVFVWRMSVPAPYFLIYWFIIQFFNGIGSISEVDYTGGGVAWFAHVGGFLAGMLLIRFFKDVRPRYRAWYEEE
jgi:membrane associated rhomboid family serine protease